MNSDKSVYVRDCTAAYLAPPIPTADQRRVEKALKAFHDAIDAAARNGWFPLLIVAIGIHHLSRLTLLPVTISVDSLKTYLPGATALLRDGLGFFSTADAYRTAPLNYVWPALFSADPAAIVNANFALSLVVLALVAMTATQMRDRVAGFAAALLYGTSPLIAPMFAAVLSEPQFVAGTALWLAGTAGHVMRGGGWWLVAAALGGVASVLSRPVWLPFIAVGVPVLVVVALLRLHERAWRRLLLVHVAILIPVAGYCIHNAITFGFFGVSTGGGAALYLGNHPLTWGIEPTHLLLNYDVPLVLAPWGGDHLSIAGDRALRAIGWSMIAERSWSQHVEWVLYKIGAVLFFTKGDFAADLYGIRTLRIVELALAVYGIGFIRSTPLRWWIGAAMLMQIAQMSVALYNLRYSVGSLEIGIILLASCGIARLVSFVRTTIATDRSGIALGFRFSPEGVSSRIALLIVIVLAVAFGHWHRRLSEPLQPNVARIPTRTLLELHAPTTDAAYSNNIAPTPRGAYKVTRDEGLFAFRIPEAIVPGERGFDQVWSIDATITPAGERRCHGGRISYESFKPLPDVPFTAIPIELVGDGKRRSYSISATYPLSTLHAAGAGVLRFRPFCPEGTLVTIHRIALLESTSHRLYQSRVEAR